MRIDSCRKCGQELQIMQICGNCDQPLHFECNNCITFVDVPIHQHENFALLKIKKKF
jgi:predicted amidophosphoribosyltransferase